MGTGLLIREDLRANHGDPRSQYVMLMFRACQWLKNSSSLTRRIAVPLRAVYMVTVVWILGIDLPLGTRVGAGLRLLHAYGLVVHQDTKIGEHCVLKHGCTLGVRSGPEKPEYNRPPILGNRVDLGPGAQVLGPCVIGDDAVIGAGAIVLIDVPAGAVAVGNPARVV
jgi:putative colanic acid biosynthesis acetyltransferase WcaB